MSGAIATMALVRSIVTDGGLAQARAGMLNLNSVKQYMDACAAGLAVVAMASIVGNPSRPVLRVRKRCVRVVIRKL
jgi:hypothetical protein